MERKKERIEMGCLEVGSEREKKEPVGVTRRNKRKRPTRGKKERKKKAEIAEMDKEKRWTRSKDRNGCGERKEVKTDWG